MMYARPTILILFLFFVFGVVAQGQTCSALGQNPSSAFPVCGTTKFIQQTVPICYTHSLTVPGCDARAGYTDYNPFWYRFTCFQSGTLSFLVTPNNSGDDYDWQLYDITGHNPDDVFTNSSIVVAGNWAGTYGITGARSGGSKTIECASDPADKENSFAAMPNLIKDHVYLLLISHFTNTQSGYSLSFSGGTASITDTTTPSLKTAQPNCEGNEVILRLGKKMKCSSLAADGSDFSIDANDITITSAQAAGCSSGFDMDSLYLTLSSALPAGNYFVTVKKGDDENTLLDNCDNELKEGSALPVVVAPKQPTPFDSIAPLTCAPQVIELVFDKPIRCSSIAENGSDFSISSTYPVAIDAAYGSCDGNGISSSIFVHLSHALTEQGIYTITTKSGLDGNTIIDECGEETPELQSVSFSVNDTVSASFNASLAYGCKADTVSVSHDGSHNVNSWLWTLSDDVIRTKQNNIIVYPSYGEKDIQLVVSNGFCSDTASSVLHLDNQLKADFVAPNVACPNDKLTFIDTSIGNIITYQWDFGNGSTSNQKNPLPQTFIQANAARNYAVKLVVENNLYCTDSLTKFINVPYSCFIAVPSAFTPNGDGINDYLYPLNAYKAGNLLFTVYNRLGQVVYQTKDWTKKWDGNYSGHPQPSGTYVWTLQYTQSDTKQFFSLQGTTVLIR